MVQENKVQAKRHLSCRNPLFGFALRTVEFCRRPIVAYIAIAFAIGFGFHELENRTDQQLAKSIVRSCQESNHIRFEVNLQLRKIQLSSLKGKPEVVTIPLANCNKISGP